MFRLALLYWCTATALGGYQDAPAEGRGAARVMRVYVGSYTGAKSRGITLLELDLVSGALTSRGLAAEVSNPTFLAIHPGQKLLYAVNEEAGSGRDKAGSVSSFTITPGTGMLTFLNRESSRGPGPCHLALDRQAKNVLVANYTGGSVAVLPIAADGRLRPASAFVQHKGAGADSKRQAGPHAHSINVDPANKYAVAADLGLDRLLVYRFDADAGTLTPNNPPSAKVAPGSGPRHFAFHPDGRHAYVINEMRSTVTAFDYDAAHGTLEALQTITTLPEGFHGSNTTAEVQVHPSGKFLYGSNRGHDSIATFAIDAVTGKLTAVGHESTRGKTPRNFGIDPTGSFLLAANQDSDTIVVFRIDPRSGRLEPTGHQSEVPRPVCVKMIPVGE